MAATSFSYAQAAQGTATPSPTGTPPPQETATIPLPSAIDWASAVEMDDDDFSAPAPASAVKETTASQEPAVKEKVPAVYAAEALPSETANKESTTSTTDAPAAAEEAPTYLYYRAPAAERQDWESTVGSEADSTSYPSFRRRSDSRREEDPGRLERPWRRADRGSMSGSIDEENRPGRLVKKFGRGGDKSSKPANAAKVQEEAEPKGELLEAPIPSFNPWTQRKDSTTTKAKLVLTSAATTATAVAASNTASVQSAKTTASSETSAAPSDSTVDKSVDSVVNGVAKPPVRKWGELPPRNGARGARVGDKDNKNGLTANDDIAWPTPETAVQEEKKKAATATAPAAEKVERSDKDSTDESAPAKSRPKEKWVAYDYVPTVSFETQLPQMRGSKPRGGARAVNGTRPAGAAAQAGDKVPAAQANKSAESRNRRESSNGASRTASLPPTNKRASLDGTQLREPRKVSNPSSGDKAKDPAATSAAATVSRSADRLTQNVTITNTCSKTLGPKLARAF